MNIGFASVAEIDLLWHSVGPRLNDAARKTKSEINAGQMWQMCRSGNAFLCIVHEGNELFAASVWRFEPDGAFRCYMLDGKNMRLWLHDLIAFITATARANGATKLQADGRIGWARFLRGATVNGDTCEVSIDG